MAEGSGGDLPMLGGTQDPARYKSLQARQRFAVAKYYGMGSDGEWTAPEIAEALDVSVRTVFRYIHESDIGDEVREVLATTDAEWRLEVAVHLRREVQRLEEIEQELLQARTAVATDYDTMTIEGTPTGDRNIRLPDDPQTYKMDLPVPVDFEVVTDYGPDLERVQKEKRQYLAQIASLLGLEAADKKEVDHTLASRHEEVKVVEFRQGEADDYPEAEVFDVDGEAAEIDVEDAGDAE